MKKKQITWYIFTNDSHTNEVISRELPAENAYNEVKCFDGVKRNLWQCDGMFITKINKNKKQKNLNFVIFKREGKYGAIKQCDFFQKKKTINPQLYSLSKTPKLKEARAYKAGKDLGLALVETIHLLYQNNTAKNYISGLMDILQVEYKKRISNKVKK